MSAPTKPTLDESAKRNPAMAPDRVRQFEQVVKNLRDRGVLQTSRYSLEPPLGGAKNRMAAAQGAKMMNRMPALG